MSYRNPRQMVLPFTRSVQSVAADLHTSESTVIRLIEDGTLTAYKLRNKNGSPHRITRDSVISYIEYLCKENGLDQHF